MTEEQLSFVSDTSVVFAVSIVYLDNELPAGRSGTYRFSTVTMESSQTASSLCYKNPRSTHHR